MSVIAIRQLKSVDLERVGEIDRSEHVTAEYVQTRDTLERREIDIQVPPWSPDADHGHSVRGNVRAWRPMLDRGGIFLGAFDSDRLVGFAVFQPELAPRMSNLAALYVNSGDRGRGIGGQLTREVIRLARERGDRRLYVSATPSVPTVEFYRSLGWEVTAEPHEEMLRAEPEDVHMILTL